MPICKKVLRDYPMNGYLWNINSHSSNKKATSEFKTKTFKEDVNRHKVHVPDDS